MRKVLDRTGSSRKLAVGVMMSRKTLMNEPTKWANVYPKKTQLAEIFLPDSKLFNVLHYADYDRKSTSREFLKAVSYAGKYLHAMQFDMIWPQTQSLMILKESAPDLAMILQVGADSMKQCDDDPEQVAERLVPYRAISCLDYVLLDKSMGKGVGMDANLLLTYIRAIKNRLPSVAIVVAGGLGPNTMGLVSPIRAEYPDVSIDAQGQLRPSKSALDPIDWKMAAEYLVQAGNRFL
jgi:hypothetical protein